MDYIWHCPGKDCRERGIILFKTQTPFLLDGQIKCPNCNTYTILKLPFKKIENEKNNEKNKMIIKGLINN